MNTGDGHQILVDSNVFTVDQLGVVQGRVHATQARSESVHLFCPAFGGVVTLVVRSPDKVFKSEFSAHLELLRQLQVICDASLTRMHEIRAAELKKANR